MFKRLLLVLILGLVLAVPVANAQDSLPPIIAVAQGDIYAINPVDGSVKQLTNHNFQSYVDEPGSQSDLALSPDGRYLAYLLSPHFFVEAVRKNEVGNYGSSPSNVMLLDLTTGEEKVIVQNDPRLTVKNQSDWRFHSGLAWSPDGTRLIFVQSQNVFDDASRSRQLLSFNLDTKQVTTLLDSVEPFWRLRWSGDKILADTRVYTDTGTLVATHYLNDGMTTDYTFPYHGTDYLMVDSADVIPHDGRVYVMNVLTGEYGVVNGYQSSISAVSPENSFVFIEDDNDTRPAYVINPKNGDTFNPPRQAPYAFNFTFAPDGQHFAYVLINTSVNISDLSGKEVVADFKATTIIWGPKQYTVADKNGDQSAPVMPTNDFDNTKRCGTLPPVSLVAGGQGKVIVGGGPNRLRSAPDPKADTVGRIPEGEVFNVIVGGQGVCAGGIRWAQVEYQGLTGWTAEGADGTAFLEGVP
ncbi:MAG: hypothetical protein GC179_10660 [Anaerolineaceae bacterium]|nr:hypothetical protein [Anaerolineaceae bacterium]